MPAPRTKQGRAGATPRRRIHHGQAQPGRRFTRSAPATPRGRLPRRRRQPDPSRVERLVGLVRNALPGGGSATKRKRRGAAKPGRRGRKPALLGLMGAGAAGAAMAAKRRKASGAHQAAETVPQPEPRTAPDSSSAD
jgi:hypothetical protein